MDEDKKTTVTDPVDSKVSGEEVKEEKTFTQKELDDVVESRLAKYKKTMPSKEELSEFKNWKESQKTEKEKQDEKEKEYQKTVSKKEELEKILSIRDAGVSKEDADYVLFKLSKMDGNFNDNMSDFLKENPKFLNSSKEVTQIINLGGEHKETTSPDLSKMSYEEYKKYRKNNK